MSQEHRTSDDGAPRDAREGETLDTPPPASAPEREAGAAQERAADREVVGDRIGPYTLLERIGEGGFGTVYLARQDEPVRRRVALKIIKLGMDTRQVIARFEAERQALAMMDHAGIARVLDAGATDAGRPYFVMELVRGVPVTEYCDRRNLDVKARLDLFMEVCHAVQHAHLKGVIHRDLKPSNILVAEQDDRPVPKVIDFGIAKATSASPGDGAIHTQQRQLIGTPAYMSPEQADASGLDIDTRSDIYSLGVILYELLTGEAPIDDETLHSAPVDQVSRIIREFEPQRPSARLRRSAHSADGERRTPARQPERTAKSLRGDLDLIVMKAIEKDRARRYETANALAMDIRRHLRSEPVLAGPPSPLYRFGKFARRNRVGLTAAACVFLALVAGLTAAGVGFRRASIERDRAVAARFEAEQARDESEAVTGFLSNMLAAADPGRSGRDVLMRDVLDVASASIDAELRDDPVVEARLRDTMGRTYLELGLYEEASRHLAPAYETRRSALGESHDATLSSLIAMARLAAARGEYDEARRLVESSLEEAEEDSPRALDAAHQLGVIDLLQARYEDAGERLRAVLERRETLLGPEHRETLETARALARLHREQGRWEEAASLMRRTLDAQRTSLGAEHPETLRTQSGLAWLTFRVSGAGEAASLYTQTLDACERVLGSEHPFTLGVAADFALTLLDAGEYDRAGAILSDRIERFQRVLGEAHPDSINTLAGLALVRRRQGQTNEAARLLETALERSERALGAEHPDTLRTLINLANVRLDQDRPEDAEPLLERALAGQRSALGEDHADAVATRITLASVYSRTGRVERAAELYREAIEAGGRSLGPDHRNTLVATVNLAILLRGQGEHEEAERLYRSAIGVMERTMGAEHPTRLRTMNNLAELLVAMGRTGEAEALHRRTLDLRAGALGESHPDTLVSMDNLARLYEAAQRPRDAALTLQRKAEALARRHGEEHPETLAALMALGEAWLAADAPDQARAVIGRLMAALEAAAAAPDAPPGLLTSAAWLFLHCEPEDMQNPDGALTIAQRAVETTRREDPDALDLLAQAQARTGDPQTAEATWNEALALLPTDDPRREDLQRRMASLSGN